MHNLYYKAFEVIQLSSQADDIMSMAVAEVIKPIEQVGLMFSDNLLETKSKMFYIRKQCIIKQCNLFLKNVLLSYLPVVGPNAQNWCSY